MVKESQDKRGTTHARIFTDTKERVAEVARTMAFREKKRITEIRLMDELLEEGLAKRERKLGI
jgi:hypothetical protein